MNYRKWDIDEVLKEIRGLESLSPRYVQGNFSALYGAAIRFFGSWKKAVEAAGVRYESAISRKTHGFWTRERVIEEIRLLKKCHSSDVKKTNVRLYSAAIRIFSGWKEALVASGMDYESILESHKSSRLASFANKKRE